MSISYLADTWRAVRPWRIHLILVIASILVLTVPPHALDRLEHPLDRLEQVTRRVKLDSTGIEKEVESAWARWLARREGVVVFSRGASDEKTVALTFDDGPHPRTCTAILDVLHREGVHATFFPVGMRLREYPELLDRMVAEGHEVANHTWTHRRLSALTDEEMRRGLPALTDEEVRQEIRKVRDLVYLRTGIAPTLLRPPGGTYDSRVLRICGDEGFEVCLWTANGGDWKKMPVKELQEKVLDQIRPGAIVLMHDEFMQTPEALSTIIHELRARGYRFLTASEMRGAPPPAFERPVPDLRSNIALVPGSSSV